MSSVLSCSPSRLDAPQESAMTGVALPLFPQSMYPFSVLHLLYEPISAPCLPVSSSNCKAFVSVITWNPVLKVQLTSSKISPSLLTFLISASFSQSPLWFLVWSLPPPSVSLYVQSATRVPPCICCSHLFLFHIYCLCHLTLELCYQLPWAFLLPIHPKQHLFPSLTLCQHPIAHCSQLNTIWIGEQND